MATDGRLEELLADPLALVYAFDPLGATGVPVPESLGVPADRRADSVRPLELLDPATRAAAVVAFDGARREGHGSADVHLGDHADAGEVAGGHSWLEIFDVVDDHGCYLAVIVPRDVESPHQRTATTLLPRRAAYDLDVTGVIESVNEAFTAMLGWTEADLVGESALSIIHPDDHEAGIIAWVELIEAPGSMTRIRQRFLRSDGTWLWCDCTDRNELDDPTHPRIVGEIIDISTQIAAEATLHRREAMLDRLYRALPTGVLVLDADGSVGAVNDRWLELVGPVDSDPIGTLLDRIGERAAVASAIVAAKTDGIDHDLALSLIPSATCQFATLHVRPLLEDGEYAGLLLTFDDTTERRLHERELAAQMRRDPLTEVLNRFGVEEVLEERLAWVNSPPLNVLYLDVDAFKSVNDHHGHAMGDHVLCEIARAVSCELRSNDILGRIGGDEFLVIADGAPTDIEAVANRIRARIDQLSIDLDLTESFGVSIGCAHRHPGDDFDSLVGRADAAMYEDKAIRRMAEGRERRADAAQPAIG